MYHIDASKLTPTALRELHVLIPYVKAEEHLREHWWELSPEEVLRFATVVYGVARAENLAAKRVLQVQIQKQAREGRM